MQSGFDEIPAKRRELPRPREWGSPSTCELYCAASTVMRVLAFGEPSPVT
jgi:hypothetical protein